MKSRTHTQPLTQIHMKIMCKTSKRKSAYHSDNRRIPNAMAYICRSYFILYSASNATMTSSEFIISSCNMLYNITIQNLFPFFCYVIVPSLKFFGTLTLETIFRKFEYMSGCN